MKWIFFQLEKTGGFGLCKYLTNELGDRAPDVTRTVPKWKPYIPKGPVEIITGHRTYMGMHKGKLTWKDDEILYFTYWRDPAERLWSQHKALCVLRGDFDFSDWILGNKYLPRLCYCLNCRGQAFEHRDHPMYRFYASKIGGNTPGKARQLLEQTLIVPMEQIDLFQRDILFPSLNLNGAGYVRMHVSNGSPIPDEYRRLVYETHPEDLALYQWGLEKNQSIGITEMFQLQHFKTDDSYEVFNEAFWDILRHRPEVTLEDGKVSCTEQDLRVGLRVAWDNGHGSPSEGA